jgi:uncharacterized protein (TIGR03067 family)
VLSLYGTRNTWYTAIAGQFCSCVAPDWHCQRSVLDDKLANQIHERRCYRLQRVWDERFGTSSHSRKEFNAMLTSNLKQQTALFVVLCFICTAMLLSPVRGQSPVVKKNGKANVAGGQQSESDQEKVQGAWQIMSIAMEGKTVKREDKLDAWKSTFLNEVQIQGDQFRQAEGNKAKFKLDDTREPKQITIQDAEGKLTFCGIYVIEDDNLKVCINGDGKSVRRPEEFATRKGAPLIMISMQKAPEKK